MVIYVTVIKLTTHKNANKKKVYDLTGGQSDQRCRNMTLETQERGPAFLININQRENGEKMERKWAS